MNKKKTYIEKKEEMKCSCKNINLPSGLNRELWNIWIDYRCVVKPFKTINGAKVSLERLKDLQKITGQSYFDIVDFTMGKEWKTFYPRKE